MPVSVERLPRFLSVGADDARSTVIILHGYGGRREEMLPLALFLAERGWHCLLPDLPGHGSDEGPFSLERIAWWRQWLLELADAKQAQLIGHSLGGLVVLEQGAGIALSPPVTPVLDGGKKEVLRTLRPQFVRGDGVLEVLRQVIESASPNDWRGVAIVGEFDIASAREALALRSDGLKVVKLKGAFHEHVHQLLACWELVYGTLEEARGSSH